MDGTKNDNNTAPVDEVATSLQNISIDKPNPIENLTEPQKKRLEQIKGVQSEIHQYELQYEQEWNLLKAKYEKFYRPLYQKRSSILCTTEEDEVLKEDETGKGTPGIPNFWLHCFLNNHALEDMIEPHDMPVLSYLRDVRAEWMDETKQESFKLIFEFAENPYFTPLILEKQYHISTPENKDKTSEENKYENEPALTHTTCTEIIWTNGKDITKKMVTRKQRNKRTKQTRTVNVEVQTQSFFNFFKALEVPDEEQLRCMDCQDAADLNSIVAGDYEMGVCILETIIPRATNWYLGIEPNTDDEEDEDEDVSDDEEESSDDSGFGEEEDDEEDEEDEEDVPSRKTQRMPRQK